LIIHERNLVVKKWTYLKKVPKRWYNEIYEHESRGMNMKSERIIYDICQEFAQKYEIESIHYEGKVLEKLF